MPFLNIGKHFNLQAALRAPFWTRVGSSGRSWVLGGLTGVDIAKDNNFQSTAYDPSGYPVNTEIPCDTNGYTTFNNPGGTLITGQLAVPAAPTVTPNTAGGATTVAYGVVGRTASGLVTGISAVTQITTSQSALTGAVYNSVGVTLVPGTAYYDIYRTVGLATQGKIGTIAATSLFNTPSATTATFLDTGLVGDSTTAPALNTTGILIANNGLLINNAIEGTAVITLTAAQIATLFATPLTIFPAPGPNKVLLIDDIVVQYKPGGTAFTGGGVITFQYHGTAINPHSSNVAASTLNTLTASVNVLPVPTSNIVAPPNVGLDILNATGAFATGNGSIIITIYYAIQTLS